VFPLLILPLFNLLLWEEVSRDIVLDAHTRCALQCFQVRETFSLNEVEILLRVEVRLIFRLEMELVVVSIELVKIIHWDLIIQFLVQANARLIGPASRYILDCVSPST
jgi:hypothetical protein